MKRLLFAVLVVGLFAAGMTGCHASADVQPNHASTAVLPN